MSETKTRRIGRSIGAVLVGLLVVVVLSVGTDVVLHSARVFPPWGQPTSDALLLLATAYRTLYSIAGAYLTALLAPDRPMGHALMLGAVGLVLASVGALATWNKGPAFGPHWYPLALVALAVPQCWLGGKLRVLRLGAREPA
jgi:hypothetical protein